MTGRLLTLTLALTALGCAPTTASLRIIHTTDIHGAYLSGSTGEGGAQALATRLAQEQAAGRSVLLVDSGDMWSGTLLSDMDEGATGVAVFNLLGYDAVALGNHEFDYGPIGPAREQGDAPFGALAARIAELESPVLCANLLDRETGQIPHWPGLVPSTVVDRGGFRVGIIGVIDEETPEITFPYVGRRLAFTDPIEAVRREAEVLRDSGADVVLVVAHLGTICRDLTDPHDLATCREDLPAFRMAEALPPGLVDAIFGGHTHRRVAHIVNGVPILQGAPHFGEAATLDLTRDDAGLRWQFEPPEALATVDASIPQVAAVRDLLEPRAEQMAARRNAPLGATLARPLTRDREESSELGAFICDVLLTRHADRQICLVNSGGLRADLPAGALSYGQVYDAMPFGNSVAYMDIPGRVLVDMIRHGTSGGHGVVQVAGLKARYDRGRDGCPELDRNGDGKISLSDRDRLREVTLANGEPVLTDRTYRIITNSFIASGGDGYGPYLRDLPDGAIRIRYDIPPIREQVVAWLREGHAALNDHESPVRHEGRVTAVGVERGLTCGAP